MCFKEEEKKKEGIEERKNRKPTFKKFASMLLAMALANNVLPVPGGP